MSATVKTLAALGITLVALVLYVAIFVFGLYFVFYAALGLTFVILAVLVVLTAGPDLIRRSR